MNAVTKRKVTWLLNPNINTLIWFLTPYVHPTMCLYTSSLDWYLLRYLDVLWLSWDSYYQHLGVCISTQSKDFFDYILGWCEYQMSSPDTADPQLVAVMEVWPCWRKWLTSGILWGCLEWSLFLFTLYFLTEEPTWPLTSPSCRHGFPRCGGLYTS